MSRYRQSMREALEQVAQVEVYNEAVKWEVKITGLPTFYADGKSRGEVKQALRKMLKRPDDIQSIERTTPSELKKIRRGQIAGDEPGETKEEVEDAFDYKAKKGAIAAPGSGSIAKVKKAKAGDVNKSIEQQMKDALKEKMSVDDVVNAIQFGKPFKVVDEDIPAELPPGDPNFPKYKDIPNSVVDKEDKKANKVKDKAEKDTLVPTQTQEGVGVTDDSGYTRYPSSGNWAGIKTGQKKTKSHAEIRKAIDPKGVAGKDLDKRISKSLRGEDVEVEVEIGETSDQWKINFKKQSAKRRGEAKRRQEAQRDSPGQRVLPRPKKEEVEIDELVVANRGSHPDSPIRKERPEKRAERLNKQKARERAKYKAARDELRKNEEVEIDEWGDTSILHQKSVALQGRPGLAPKRKPKDAQKKDAENQNKDPVGKQHEVAPPGWGHTKAEKEKTKPNKPKSKIGGTAHEFDKDLKSGKFKGLPGDKTYKDKKASMFKLMWSMKKKGDKPHYKPGVKDKLKSKYKDEQAGYVSVASAEPRGLPGLNPKKKSEHQKHEASDTWHPNPEKDKKSTSYKHYAKERDALVKAVAKSPKQQASAKKQKADRFGHIKITQKGLDALKKGDRKEENILESAKRYLVQEKSDWNTAFKSAAQSRPAMKYKDAVNFIDTAGLNSVEKRSALKAAKRWLR